MNFLCLFFLLFSLVLNGSEAQVSESSRARHVEKRQYLQTQEDFHQSWWDRRYFFGDPKGRLARLARKGITLDSTYVTNIVANPVGGKAKGFAYAGSYGLSMDIDFTQYGLKGFEFFTSAVWRTGTSLSARKIDNQFPVQQVFGSQTVKLNELYLLQSFFDDRWILKAGRLDAGSDFFASPLYGRFVNNSFNGNPISIFFNVPFTAYPNSTWGAYTEIVPFKWLSQKFAAFNANSEIKANKYHGVNFTFESTNGVIWITEWNFMVNQGKEDTGYPGNYKVGYFYLTGDEDKFSGGKQSGDHTFYILFDQMIYRVGGSDSKRGLTPFINFIFAPKNRNLFPFFTNGGFVFRGPFASRPDDFLSFGFTYGKYSSDQADVQRSRGEPPQSFEGILELNYWIQANYWLYIVPDLQYVIRPKGLGTPNAFVLGAEIGFELW